MTFASQSPSSTTLAALIERITIGDWVALRQVFSTLCEPVQRELRRTMPDDEDVQAVVHGTFVEIWWLARFHTDEGDDDILGWIIGIAKRRAIERNNSFRSPAQLRLADQTSLLAFQRLLGTAVPTPRSKSASR